MPANSIKPPIIIIGAGGHARVVYSLIQIENKYNCLGFLDSDFLAKGEKIGSHEVIGDFTLLTKLRDDGVEFAAVSYGDNYKRHIESQKLNSMGYKLPNLIHPSAKLELGHSIGTGNLFAVGSIVGCYVKIGNNCLINTGSTIDHECTIGDSVHIGPGSHLAGRVNVGCNSFIGIGSTVIDKINIGKNVIIGAGSVVIESIPDNVVALGVPAKVIKNIPSQDNI